MCIKSSLDNGGGRLMFYVGRYHTGSIHMKSNVTIQLEEGAIIVGSTNPFDYEKSLNFRLIILSSQCSKSSLHGDFISGMLKM
jgi:polygalacturonase